MLQLLMGEQKGQVKTGDGQVGECLEMLGLNAK